MHLSGGLSTPGIDGVFMGPSDLSVTLSNGAEINPTGPRADEAAALIAEKAKQHGLFVAGFATTPQKAADVTADDLHAAAKQTGRRIEASKSAGGRASGSAKSLELCPPSVLLLLSVLAL